MPIRTTLAALCLSSLVTVAVLAAAPTGVPSDSVGPRAEHVLAPNDLPPSCPLCGGGNFADLVLLTRMQMKAAIVVALTI